MPSLRLLGAAAVAVLLSPSMIIDATLAEAADRAGTAAAQAREPQVKYRAEVFGKGDFDGTEITGGAVTIKEAVGTVDYQDPFGDRKTYEYARWTSPSHDVGFDATQLVASWTARVPKGSWMQVDMRARTVDGRTTKWYVMGRWAEHDPKAGGAIHRTTVPDQGDKNGHVDVDTFVAKKAFTGYQLRVTLLREPGADHVRPRLRTAGAMASLLPKREQVPPSPGGGAWGIELDVPRKSQNIHEGHFPEWDGGGEAWCSPTSTAMVLDYWKTGPDEEDMDWVPDDDPNPEVDYAARNTYDYAYEGAGNWPFNTAYAGRFGLTGFITRLTSLTEAEKYIKAGIPVITSQSFKEEELPGAGYGTNGHIMVIIGFTEDGDVIANDPASSSNRAVRRVYPRANFENVWQRTTSSGGIAYIIAPAGRTPR